MEVMLEWIQLLLEMVIIADVVIQEARCRSFSYDCLVLYYFPEIIDSGCCIRASVPYVVPYTTLLLLLYSDLTDLYVLDL